MTPATQRIYVATQGQAVVLSDPRATVNRAEVRDVLDDITIHLGTTTINLSADLAAKAHAAIGAALAQYAAEEAPEEAVA